MKHIANDRELKDYLINEMHDNDLTLDRLTKELLYRKGVQDESGETDSHIPEVETTIGILEERNKYLYWLLKDKYNYQF